MLASRSQRFSTSSRPSSSSRRHLTVRASTGSSTGLFKDGQAVKVIAPVTLFSVPKHPDGISIQGMTGEVFKDVSQFKGKVLSANLPYVVKFKTTLNGADIKFQAHLVSFPQEGQLTLNMYSCRGVPVGMGGQLCL